MGLVDVHEYTPKGAAEWRAPVVENVKDPRRMVEVAKKNFQQSGDAQALLKGFKNAYAESGYDKNLGNDIMKLIISLTNGERRVVEEFKKLVDQSQNVELRTEQKYTGNGNRGADVVDITSRIESVRQKVTTAGEVSTDMLREVPDDDWVNKAKRTVVSRPPVNTTQQTEKPGFFKRLFGGGR